MSAIRDEPAAKDAALPASAAPQSSQNAEEGAFSAPHFGQRIDNGLPQAAQNFLPVMLSAPHLVHRIAGIYHRWEIRNIGETGRWGGGHSLTAPGRVATPERLTDYRFRLVADRPRNSVQILPEYESRF
jgi:hypothetical protein